MRKIFKVLRFEIFFFLYFLSYMMTERLNWEYTAALSYKQFYNENKLQQTNMTLFEGDRHLLPLRYSDVTESLCGAYSEKRAGNLIAELTKNVEYNQMTLRITQDIPSALMTVFFGFISDFAGKRKFFLVMASFTEAFRCMMLIFHYYTGGTLSSLTAIALICGFLGNRASAIVSLITYVADITSPKMRFLYMTVSLMLIKISETLGQGPVTVWIQIYGLQPVIWVAFASNYFIFKFTLGMMVESQATDIEYRGLSFWGFIGWVHHMVTRQEGEDKSKIAAIFDRYYNVVLVGYSSMAFILTSYTQQIFFNASDQISCKHSIENERFNQLESRSALIILFHFFGFAGCLIVTFVLIKLRREIPIGLMGIVSTAVGLIYLPFADSLLQYAMGFGLMFLHMAPVSLYLAQSSKHTSPETQAIALSVLHGCAVLASVFAYVLNYYLYFRAGSYRQEALLWLYAGLLIVPTALFIKLGLYSRDPSLKRQVTWGSNTKVVDVPDDKSLT